MNTDPQERIEAIGEQLRAKISSKFQVSAFLAGFAFTILSMQVSEIWDDQSKSVWLLFISASLMIAAIILYIFSIIKLDELTMPKRFWEEDDTQNVNMVTPLQLGCLTDDDLLTLKKRMVFYWQYLTIVATWLTVISILLMLLPFADKNKTTYSSGWGWLFFSVFVIIGIAAGTYTRVIIAKASNMGKMVRAID